MQRKSLSHHAHAGQFLFVKFEGEKGLDESHPFTISSAPSDDMLRLTIKSSGDFTRHLFANLKVGTSAVVEGAYGMFNYKTGGEKQIWVAGGIGVTPFLSFLRDLKDDLSHHVDFYYTVRHKEETVFVDEIEGIVKKYPRLKALYPFLVCTWFSDRGGDRKECGRRYSWTSRLHVRAAADGAGL